MTVNAKFHSQIRASYLYKNPVMALELVKHRMHIALYILSWSGYTAKSQTSY